MKEGRYYHITFIEPPAPYELSVKGIYLGRRRDHIQVGTYLLEPKSRWTLPENYSIPIANVKHILEISNEGPFESISHFIDPRLSRSIQEAQKEKNRNDARRERNAIQYGLMPSLWNR